MINAFFLLLLACCFGYESTFAMQPSPESLRFDEDCSEPVPEYDPAPDFIRYLPSNFHSRIEFIYPNTYRVRGTTLRYGMLPRSLSSSAGGRTLSETVGAKTFFPRGRDRNAFHDFAIEEEGIGDVRRLFILVRTYFSSGLLAQDEDGYTPLHLALGCRHFVKALNMTEAILMGAFGEEAMREVLQAADEIGTTILQRALHMLYYALEYKDSEEEVRPLLQFIQLTAPFANLDQKSEARAGAQEFQASPRDFFTAFLVEQAACTELLSLFSPSQPHTPAVSPATTSAASPDKKSGLLEMVGS